MPFGSEAAERGHGLSSMLRRSFNWQVAWDPSASRSVRDARRWKCVLYIKLLLLCAFLAAEELQ